MILNQLLETATTAVFSTQRSGSNEVFLRTSFQYSKSDLRKKLLSYFPEEHELRNYDTKVLKKKNSWCEVIKKKKDRLLKEFLMKRKQFQSQNIPNRQSTQAIQPMKNAFNFEGERHSAHSLGLPSISTGSTSVHDNSNSVFPNVGAVSLHHDQSTSIYTASPPNHENGVNGLNGPRYQFGSAIAQSSPMGHGMSALNPVTTSQAFQSQPLQQRQLYRQQYLPNGTNPVNGAPFGSTNEIVHGYQQRNDNPEMQMIGYGHHRMTGTITPCNGCHAKQRMIDELQRQVTMLRRQQYQVSFGNQIQRESELIPSQNYDASAAVCFDSFHGLSSMPWPHNSSADGEQ